MSERKVWSNEEDKALWEIINKKKVKKWKDIAKMMSQEYMLQGRTGKQCRERWHNQLNPQIKKEEWGEEEEATLFRCHDEYGNKWAKIAKQLPGRTDNCIKNHFYSTLRKAVRKLNRFVSECRNRESMKEIKPITLSKIIIVSGERWDKGLPSADQLVKKCMSIKERLIKLSNDAHAPLNNEEREMRKLVMDIMDFSKLYKRKKNRRKKRGEEENQEIEMAEEELKEQQQEEQEIDNEEVEQPMPEPRLIPAPPVVSESPTPALAPLSSSIKKVSDFEMTLKAPSRFPSSRNFSQISLGDRTKSMQLDQEQKKTFEASANLNASSGMDTVFNGLNYRKPSELNFLESIINEGGTQLNLSTTNSKPVIDLFTMPKDTDRKT